MLQLMDAGQALDRVRDILGIDPSKSSTGGPILVHDPEANAIIVRGTEAQVADVRKVLKILGEDPSNTGPVRIIPFGKGNPIAAAREAERIMGQLRNIPVKVIIQDDKPAPQPPKDNKDNIKKNGPNGGGEEAQDEPAATGKSDARPQVNAQDKKGDEKQPKPVTITVAGDHIIITGDDPETRALAEQIIRLHMGPSAGSGDFEVIKLKRVSAVEAAKVLNEFFNGPQQSSQQNALQAMFSRFGAGG